MNPSKESYGRGNLEFLDGLRGLAALVVLVGHARYLLWEGYSEGFLRHPDQYSSMGKLFVFGFGLFRYGHEAVIFFFVLSGFVIHLRYARELSSKGMAARFDWRTYCCRRVKRLYPPLLFALALTWMADIVGANLGYGIYFQQSPSVLINQNISVNHDWVTAVGNLCFLMNSYVPIWGTNGPLWSLKFEWWFYMLYPVFWWFSKRSILLATSLMGVLWMASFVPKIWPLRLASEIFSMMLAWWFGALLADVIAGRIPRSTRLVSFLSPLLLVVPLVNDNIVRDIVLAGGFVGIVALCFELLKWNSSVVKGLSRLKPLGDMSYTLYVVHFPILVLMSGYATFRSNNHQLPMHFGWVAFGIMFCLLFSYLCHLLIEVPFVSRGTPLQVPIQTINSEVSVLHS